MEKETSVKKPTEETENADVDKVTNTSEVPEEREEEKSKPFSKLMKMLSFSKKD